MLLQTASHAEKPYRGKYINEAKIPLPSGIGIEIGQEKEEQVRFLDGSAYVFVFVRRDLNSHA